jgi:GrpB-like predicted nucleotidyltransferase (UPF0157 family)
MLVAPAINPQTHLRPSNLICCQQQKIRLRNIGVLCKRRLAIEIVAPNRPFTQCEDYIVTEKINLTEDEIKRFISEEVSVLPYDPEWPMMFEDEKKHLLALLPSELIGRVEHFGSTAVPGLSAKPIIDMLVEVKDLMVVRETVAPMLQSLGYDYMWRPSGLNSLPYFALFIKRNNEGVRSHHIHMVEPYFRNWERLKFRDYLRANPESASAYAKLKYELAVKFPNDRGKYNMGKKDFVDTIMVSLGFSPSLE